MLNLNGSGLKGYTGKYPPILYISGGIPSGNEFIFTGMIPSPTIFFDTPHYSIEDILYYNPYPFKYNEKIYTESGYYVQHTGFLPIFIKY